MTRAESHRAGTGKENPRRRNKGDRAEGVVEPLLQYPWKRGKEQPRGYRERKPADIPAEARKRAAARVQGRKTRVYTRGNAEKSNRAGTGRENPRINPWKRGKEQPRGYRERKLADIPVNMRRLSPRELYTLFRLRYGSIRVPQKTPRHNTSAAVCTRRCLIRRKRILASDARATKRERAD